MIPIISRETSERRKWIKQTEMLDIIAISESTPGPIAVNAATYIGFNVGKIWGSFFATLGLVLPSFLIILGISYCYDWFMSLTFITAIFKGLRVGVIILLFNAFLKLLKSVKLTPFTIIIFILILGVNLTLAILNISFNFASMCMLAFGLICGIIATAITKRSDV